MKKLWPLFLLVVCVAQIILAMIAEHNEDYTKAIYEMLWLFFFAYLLHFHEEEN